MRTPQAVKDAARELTEMYKTKYVHLGQYKGYEVYTLRFLETAFIGLPEVYLYKEGKKVKTIWGEDVFEVMDATKKNTRERRKAARLVKQSNLKDLNSMS